MHSASVLCVERTLGEYIRERREVLGLNQTELSRRADVPRETINRLENNKTALPFADTRRRLANALGVSHIDLLIAAGELNPDEVRVAGVELVVPPDPIAEAMIAKLRRIRWTPMVVRVLDGALDALLLPDTVNPVQEEQGALADAFRQADDTARGAIVTELGLTVTVDLDAATIALAYREPYHVLTASA